MRRMENARRQKECMIARALERKRANEEQIQKAKEAVKRAEGACLSAKYRVTESVSANWTCFFPVRSVLYMVITLIGGLLHVFHSYSRRSDVRLNS